MNYTEPFVLGEDVLLVSCAELGDDLRRRITFDEGDFTLSRRHGRAAAQVIDRVTAALLALFREPRTIVDAVFENSRAIGRDAEEWFEALVPHLGTFVENRVLVPAGSGEITPLFDDGATFGAFTIVRCASLLEDRDLYEMRGPDGAAALKIAREDDPHLLRLFRNEAAILRRLEGSAVAPRLLESGELEGRSYLILEWLSGVDAGEAADRRRHDRGSMIDLCVSIAAAYAALHDRGVVHADVHWQNMLVDGRRVRLLDFGYSRFTDRPPRMGRGAIPLFLEPEYMAAERRGRSKGASMAGEQYSVAALLYLLITGRPYLDLRFEREEMARQIETGAPLPFGWPEVETILFRALEKDPRRRHASMAEMAALLAEVRESMTTPLSDEANAFVDRTLPNLDGEALLRIAQFRDDPALLALSERRLPAGPVPVALHLPEASALLDDYDRTGDLSCLSRARELANHGVTVATTPAERQQLAVLIADLQRRGSLRAEEH